MMILKTYTNYIPSVISMDLGGKISNRKRSLTKLDSKGPVSESIIE